ncbi:hypothetical protein [Peribacillus tepidiphilus]
MQVFLFVFLGMIMAYGLVFALSEFGLILLAGGAFGLLLYIAINISKK